MRKVWAMVAVVPEPFAPERQMANARRGPQIVHGPNHGLATFKYLPDAGEREHALIDP